MKYFEEAAAKEAERNTKIKTIENQMEKARNGVNTFKGTDKLKKTFETKLTEFKTAVEAWKQMESGPKFDKEYERLIDDLVLFKREINQTLKQQSEKES